MIGGTMLVFSPTIIEPIQEYLKIFENTCSGAKRIVFLAVQDATFYSEDKIDKKYLSTGR